MTTAEEIARSRARSDFFKSGPNLKYGGFIHRVPLPPDVDPEEGWQQYLPTTWRRQEVVDEARAHVGTPWHHQAALKGVGCDCIGTIVSTGEQLGMPLAAVWKADERFRNYGKLPLSDKLLASCSEYMDEIPIHQAGLGDVLVLTFARDPMHFAIVSAVDANGTADYIIHGWEPRGKVVENRIDEIWRKRIVKAFRLRGVV